MPTKQFMCTQYGGMSLMVAGVVFTIGILLHPDEADPNFVFDSLWSVVHIGLGIGILLGMYGFIALMHRFTEKVSLGANLAIGALIGTLALLSGLILFVEGFVFPAIGANANYAALLSPSGPLLGGDFGTAFTVVLALFSIAAIATGYYISTMKEFTHWSGWLLFAAPLIAFAPPLPYVVFLVGGVVFGVGLFVIGKDLKKL